MPQTEADDLKLYLKIEDSYHFVLRAWRGQSNHPKHGGPAIFFESWDTRIIRPAGATHVHFTYPHDGAFHKTYEFEDGKRVHVHPDRISIILPRELVGVSLPTIDDMGWMGHLGPYQYPPAFDRYAPDTMHILPMGGGFPMPHAKPNMFNPSKAREPDWEVLETAGMEGTLNLHVFVAGGVDTKILPYSWTPTFTKTFIRGKEPPFFGAVLSLFANVPRGNGARRMEDEERV